MNGTIINGIDVSECVHLDEWKHCNICEELIKTISDRHQCVTEQDLRCEYYSDCYFKQLKHLQEENEKLREEIYATRNNRLKMYESFETECNKYKQTLEEIRSYCDEQNLKADYTACYITNRIDEVFSNE